MSGWVGVVVVAASTTSLNAETAPHWAGLPRMNDYSRGCVRASKPYFGPYKGFLVNSMNLRLPLAFPRLTFYDQHTTTPPALQRRAARCKNATAVPSTMRCSRCKCGSWPQAVEQKGVSLGALSHPFELRTR